MSQSVTPEGDRAVVVRFVLNGLVATAMHYAVLVTLIETGAVQSAGVANAAASIVGITASYIGSRKFVFASRAPVASTLPSFLLIYVAVAMLHFVVLWLWTDRAGFNYSVGFVLATALSTCLTFIGNRYLVFNGGGQPRSRRS